MRSNNKRAVPFEPLVLAQFSPERRGSSVDTNQHKHTFIVSPSISTAFSLKSTPMVASVLSGKLPPVKRKVRQVLPTLESPMTMILKMRVWMLRSREEQREDAVPVLARLRLPLGKSMDDVRMVTLSSTRFLRGTPLAPPEPGAGVSSSGESLVMMPEEAKREAAVEQERGWVGGCETGGRGRRAVLCFSNSLWT